MCVLRGPPGVNASLGRRRPGYVGDVVCGDMRGYLACAGNMMSDVSAVCTGVSFV